MSNKYFIITVDTEGDNLWRYHDGDQIKTNNALFIPRFQELCERYALKPVYLTNYEMALSDEFVSYIKPKMEAGLCEIGIHVHAWNNPPLFELNRKYDGQSYLIEYPIEIMEQKFKITYDLIVKKFGRQPVSHRAGRWAMNDNYFNLLNKFGIKVDCSITPGIDWSGNNGATRGGSNYSNNDYKPSFISSILEVPLSVRYMRYLDSGSFKHIIKSLILGNYVWPRPVSQSLSSTLKLFKKIDSENSTDYIEYMLHSSELMPGGSPYFTDYNSVEQLYKTLEETFSKVREMNYLGITLEEYYKIQ